MKKNQIPKKGQSLAKFETGRKQRKPVAKSEKPIKLGGVRKTWTALLSLVRKFGNVRMTRGAGANVDIKGFV